MVRALRLNDKAVGVDMRKHRRIVLKRAEDASLCTRRKGDMAELFALAALLGVAHFEVFHNACAVGMADLTVYDRKLKRFRLFDVKGNRKVLRYWDRVEGWSVHAPGHPPNSLHLPRKDGLIGGKSGDQIEHDVEFLFVDVTERMVWFEDGTFVSAGEPE